MSAIGPIASRAANYKYAEPARQEISARQKTLLRMGPEDGAKVKLRELKQALTREL